MVGVPRDDGDLDDFADMYTFLDDYDPSETNEDRFEWVALVLKPGMTL
jgi:hypothetical protein